MTLDLSLILGKQVTFPALCYMLHLLYKDLKNKSKLTGVDDHLGVADDIPSEESMTVSNSAEKNKWKPIDLMKSVQSSLEDKSVKLWSETEPFPYQPFKPGEYRLTMGVRPLPIEHWLVFDNTFKKRIDAKWDIIKENYKDVMFHIDPAMVNCFTYIGSETLDKTLITPDDVTQADLSVCEIYNHVVGYLTARYPQYFEIVLQPGSETPGVLVNKIINEFHPVDPEAYLKLENDDLAFLNYKCFNVDIIPEELSDPNCTSDEVGKIALVTTVKTRRAHELILALQRMVEEDILLLSPNKNHQFNNEYILISGCFAFAAGFNPRERFMKPMTQIHGPVPEYKVKLQNQMNKFFQSQKPGNLVMRLNFSFQTHPNLYVTDDNKGTVQEEIKAKTLEELDGGRSLFYRSERQCLIKLEKTKSMCFSIKTYLWNIQDEFLKNDYYSQEGVIDDLRGAVRGMQDTLGQYKRRPEWGPALLELLDAKVTKDCARKTD